MVVSIGSRVFVPESHHMAEFVNNDAELVTILSDGNRLRSVTTLSDKTTASEAIEKSVSFHDN